MLSGIALPVAASAHAAEVDRLLLLVHLLMGVLAVGWFAYFGYVLVRFRRGANPKASYAGSRGRWAAIVLVAVPIAEVVLLVGYALPAWGRRMTPPPEEGATLVRVVAEQYAWNVQYPGADHAFGRRDIRKVGPENPLGLDRTDPAARDDVTTINELNVPVGRPVLVRLSSKDVIHSFGLPEMRVKQDAIPGLETPVWFTPIRIGKYEIVCSQLCGLAHYRMRGFLNVMPQAQYDAWLREQAGR